MGKSKNVVVVVKSCGQSTTCSEMDALMSTMVKQVVECVIKTLSENGALNMTMEEAIELFSEEDKSRKKKPCVKANSKDKELPMWFLNSHKEGKCSALKGELLTVCNGFVKDGLFCQTCLRTVDSDGNPKNGTSSSRTKFDYTSPSQKAAKPFSDTLKYAKLMQNGQTAEEIRKMYEDTAMGMGVTIPPENWKATKSSKGRPKNKKPDITSLDQQDRAIRDKAKQIKENESIACGKKAVAKNKDSSDSESGDGGYDGGGGYSDDGGEDEDEDEDDDDEEEKAAAEAEKVAKAAAEKVAAEKAAAEKAAAEKAAAEKAAAEKVAAEKVAKAAAEKAAAEKAAAEKAAAEKVAAEKAAAEKAAAEKAAKKRKREEKAELERKKLEDLQIQLERQKKKLLEDQKDEDEDEDDDMAEKKLKDEDEDDGDMKEEEYDRDAKNKKDDDEGYISGEWNVPEDKLEYYRNENGEQRVYTKDEDGQYTLRIKDPTTGKLSHPV